MCSLLRAVNFVPIEKSMGQTLSVLEKGGQDAQRNFVVGAVDQLVANAPAVLDSSKVSDAALQELVQALDPERSAEPLTTSACNLLLLRRKSVSQTRSLPRT